jgi:hypothetical protein
MPYVVVSYISTVPRNYHRVIFHTEVVISADLSQFYFSVDKRMPSTKQASVFMSVYLFIMIQTLISV